jgi:hypothetical protein
MMVNGEQEERYRRTYYIVVLLPQEVVLAVVICYIRMIINIHCNCTSRSMNYKYEV